MRIEYVWKIDLFKKISPSVCKKIPNVFHLSQHLKNDMYKHVNNMNGKFFDHYEI